MWFSSLLYLFREVFCFSTCEVNSRDSGRGMRGNACFSPRWKSRTTAEVRRGSRSLRKRKVLWLGAFDGGRSGRWMVLSVYLPANKNQALRKNKSHAGPKWQHIPGTGWYRNVGFTPKNSWDLWFWFIPTSQGSQNSHDVLMLAARCASAPWIWHSARVSSSEETASSRRADQGAWCTAGCGGSSDVSGITHPLVMTFTSPWLSHGP